MSEHTEAEKDKQIGYYAVAIFILLFSTIGFSTANLNASRERDELLVEVSELTESNENLTAALDNANANIESANDIITTAQGNAWSDYYSMGYALDGLSTVDTVSY